MKRLRLLLLLFPLLFASCGILTNNIMKVQEGMSRQEVSKLFGTPDFRRFDREIEEWEYREASGVPGEWKVVVITFDGDKVISMNTFTLPQGHEHHHPQPIGC
ncbi:outer membrane protein assembly factor BamE [Oscillospiraceae bacterium N12]|jgi:outer membrane protein assembly factor BamE (lipoprotein component of BamABCDE complex)|uniref:Outer membrane protein assembly factor BamE n=1 Tax=Jilunia laotingensis TaxID=2763675 RepID=A0A926F5G5_9BACT|nr:outer membrane protein assembly factor BamE [Jilunia laotingensis]MBC8592224.1 outer membrane protein assembly factor BamE [Jilunia laotingensis]